MMNVNDARKVLAQEAKRVWSRDLHPDGMKLKYHVFNIQEPHLYLPHIGITLYANGTWEFTDPNLRDEIEDEPSGSSGDYFPGGK